MFLKTYNTEFDEDIIIFTDQNGRLLEIEDKLIWHWLLINRNDMLPIEPGTRKYVNDFCHLRQIFLTNMGKKLWDADSKTGLDHAARTFSEKVVHKTAEATRKFIGNKISKKMWNQSKCEILRK